MAGLSRELHAPLDMARLSALFENEADMRLATSSGHWPFDGQEWSEWLSEPGCQAYFLRQGGADIGHFALRARGADRHLSWVLVRASRRGGMGRALLDQAVEAAQAERLTLNVMRTNARAFHLYQRYGFTALSEMDGKVHMGLDIAARGAGEGGKQ